MGLHCTSTVQGVRDSVQVREVVEKGKAIFKDSKVSWSPLDDW